MTNDELVSVRLELTVKPLDRLPRCGFSTAALTHTETVLERALVALFGPRLVPHEGLVDAFAARRRGAESALVAVVPHTEWDEVEVRAHFEPEPAERQEELLGLVLSRSSVATGGRVDVALGIELSHHTDSCVRFPGERSCCAGGRHRLGTRPLRSQLAAPVLARVFASIGVTEHRLRANVEALRSRGVFERSGAGRRFALPVAYRDDGRTVVDTQTVCSRAGSRT